MRLALSPILAPQAIVARRRAKRLPEPPGPREGETGRGPPLRLLVTGDSAAAAVGARHQGQGLAPRLAERLGAGRRVRWSVVARTGARTRDATDRLLVAPAFAADVVVVSLGLNDVVRGVPVGLWLRRRAALVAVLRERFEAGLVVMSGLPPVGIFPALPQPLRWALATEAAPYEAAGRAQVEAMEGCVHAPFDMELDVRLMAEDGYHPGPEAYRVWADALGGRIEGALAGRAAAE